MREVNVVLESCARGWARASGVCVYVHVCYVTHIVDTDEESQCPRTSRPFMFSDINKYVIGHG